MGVEKQKWLLSHEDRQWENSIWIGLTDFFTPGTLRWSMNQDQPDYTNWAYGEPNDGIMNEHPGAACARFGKDFEENDKWELTNCGDRIDMGFMCEMESGKTCPPGWTYFKVEISRRPRFKLNYTPIHITCDSF